MDLRQKCIVTMQAAELSVEHSVRERERGRGEERVEGRRSLRISVTTCLLASPLPSLPPVKWQIIPLLTKAISHFKNYHSDRMIMCLSESLCATDL